jgi:glycosyltransferase involved in cell wall biosynthesis
MIDGILKVNQNYHFYLTIPKWIEYSQLDKLKAQYPILHSPNVTLMEKTPLSEVRRMTPYDFNFRELEQVIDFWGTDYDMVWNCLPEYTNNLSQLLCRNTDLGWGHANIPFINRWHWVMANDYVAIPDTRIEFRQVEGYLFSQYNTVLCKYNAEMVKNMVNKWFPNVKVDTSTIYNGVDFNRINTSIGTEKPTKIRLLFPNRLQTFKNPMFMLECLIKLRQTRQDFELILTDPTADFTANNVLKNGKLIRIIKENSDWIKVISVSGKEYYELINSCDVVINTSDYETWGVCQTEALCCGKNIVVPSGLTFEEMTAPDYPFIYKRGNKQDFIAKIELAIKERNSYTTKNLEYGKRFDWSNVIWSYLDLFEGIRKKYIVDGKHETPDRKRLLEEIKSRGKMSKSEIQSFLGPGAEKCWTKYRWYLLQQGIEDTWDRKIPTYYFGQKPDSSKQLNLFNL